MVAVEAVKAVVAAVLVAVVAAVVAVVVAAVVVVVDACPELSTITVPFMYVWMLQW